MIAIDFLNKLEIVEAITENYLLHYTDIDNVEPILKSGKLLPDHNQNVSFTRSLSSRWLGWSSIPAVFIFKRDSITSNYKVTPVLDVRARQKGRNPSRQSVFGQIEEEVVTSSSGVSINKASYLIIPLEEKGFEVYGEYLKSGKGYDFNTWSNKLIDEAAKHKIRVVFSSRMDIGDNWSTDVGKFLRGLLSAPTK